MKFEEYLDSLRNKSVAVIGIGVSNRPLIRLLLERGIPVTACDKKSREALGPLGDELEQHGCRLQLGEDYLKDLTADVIFRTPSTWGATSAARCCATRRTSRQRIWWCWSSAPSS